MSIIKHFEDRATGLRRLYGFDKFTVESVNYPINPTFAHSVQHVLKLQVGVSYWATLENRDEARKNAETHLAYELYREPLDIVRQLRSIIHDGDPVGALALLQQLEDSMLKP